MGLIAGGLAGVMLGVIGWGVNQPEFARMVIGFTTGGLILGASIGFAREG